MEPKDRSAPDTPDAPGAPDTPEGPYGAAQPMPPRPAAPPFAYRPAHPAGFPGSGAGNGLPPAEPGNRPGNGTGRNRGRSVGAGTFLAGMLAAGLLGGGVVAGADAYLESQAPDSAGSRGAPQSVVVNDTDNVNRITGAAVKASPSVVTIAVSGGGSGGSGSGIILDDQGHILTNTHVVTLGGQIADPAVEVRTSDGQVFAARVVGTDPLSDLAVIKVDAADLQPATLGESGELNVGDIAIAIGAPLGLSGTVTDGIVSTLNRTISVASSAVPEQQADTPEQEDGDGFNFLPPDGSRAPQSRQGGSIYLSVIQTDAAINQGNSGGALVDQDGRVIGVNVAIASAGSGESAGNIGVGFAVPIDYAARVAKEIIANGEATHGFLGVSVRPAVSGGAGAQTSFSVGAQVAEVEPDSPAAQAGLREGDVITSLDGMPVNDPQALTAAVRMHPEGATVDVEFRRGAAAQTVQASLGRAEE
jgi:putative serine protease PepD